VQVGGAVVEVGGVRFAVRAARRRTARRRGPVRVTVTVIVIVFVPVAARQQPRADDIDGQSDDRRDQGGVEVDGDRREQPPDALREHQGGEPSEQQRRRVAAEGPQLPRPEGEARADPGVARGGVDRPRERHRRRMGRHVPAVGDEGHRARGVAHREFDRHRREREQQDDARRVLPAFRVGVVAVVVRRREAGLVGGGDGRAGRVQARDDSRRGARPLPARAAVAPASASAG
jgi:hypothetical protein